MKLGEFRKMTMGLPDDTDMKITNSGSEWYGTENMEAVAWQIIDECIVFAFHNRTWDDEDYRDYSELELIGTL